MQTFYQIMAFQKLTSTQNNSLDFDSLLVKYHIIDYRRNRLRLSK